MASGAGRMQFSAPAPVTIQPDGYYTERDAATLFGVTVDTLRRRRQSRSDVAFCKYGRKIFYRGDDIIAALNASRRRSTSDRGRAG